MYDLPWQALNEPDCSGFLPNLGGVLYVVAAAKGAAVQKDSNLKPKT